MQWPKKIIEMTVQLPEISDAMLTAAVAYIEQFFEDYGVSGEQRDMLWAGYMIVATRILLRNGGFPGEVSGSRKRKSL